MNLNLQDMIDHLNDFDEPNDIAGFLLASGVKGEQGDGESCPISNWILTNTDAVGVTTTEKVITVQMPVADPYFGSTYYNFAFNNSENVEQFIIQFDNGDYPDLINPDYDSHPWDEGWDDEPEPDGF